MNLPQTLQALHHHLSQLVDVLQQEQDTLLRPHRPGVEDGELLNRLAQDKEEQFLAIESLEGEREEFAKALAQITDVEPNTKKAAGELSLWLKVRELALQASRLNQLNGVLIRHRLIHNQRVLNSLRQMGGPQLYDAGGQSSAINGRLNSLA